MWTLQVMRLLRWTADRVEGQSMVKVRQVLPLRLLTFNYTQFIKRSLPYANQHPGHLDYVVEREATFQLNRTIIGILWCIWKHQRYKLPFPSFKSATWPDDNGELVSWLHLKWHRSPYRVHCFRPEHIGLSLTGLNVSLLCFQLTDLLGFYYCCYRYPTQSHHAIPTDRYRQEWKQQLLLLQHCRQT
jgi:hypothetical protein